MSASLTQHQIKVLVLYTVEGIPGPVPRHVVETALALCDANIFGIQEALHDLLHNDNLTQSYDEDNIPYLFLTHQGRCVIEALRRDAPLSYREKALAYATVEMTKLRAMIGVDAKVEKRENSKLDDYSCTLSLSDAGDLLMKVELYAPNKLQADMIAERFRKGPLDVYQKILQILTGTDAPTEE